MTKEEELNNYYSSNGNQNQGNKNGNTDEKKDDNENENGNGTERRLILAPRRELCDQIRHN